jgi:hypothetical protein
MPKNKKPPFDFKSAPEPKIPLNLAAFLLENEMMWWINRVKKTDIKKFLIRNNFYTRISNNDLLGHHCPAYMHWKRKPASVSVLLDPKQWDKLRNTAEFFKEELPGLNIEQACQVFRSRISTNEAQMAGLPARLRYWEQKTPA